MLCQAPAAWPLPPSPAACAGGPPAAARAGADTGGGGWCSGGFGYLIAGRRGPILLVALLVVATLLAWTAPRSPLPRPGVLGSPSRAGSGLPRWQLLALGMVLFLGAGWVAETGITAPRVQAEGWAQTSRLHDPLR